ncbi:unnamed protein product [Angiostrongylus costaricensis]|uniref:VWFA domain-containing protein n=1 Tax=Angiostrongylus costaricensis TaxID=334426 RepID=A0A0R3PTF8_ANGCS|nr:unnamed protein product [Angiostrongylus costaricensis]
MARDMRLGAHLLLIGNQGVGKNKIADRFLHLIQRPRQYMQLHRDTTVESLTMQTSVENGVLRYEDSALVRAARAGHVLVIDEADKAPLHRSRFLGNDLFGVLGDLFSVHIVENPSRENELEMLKKYAPDVPDANLLKLMAAFTELREMADEGLLQYPYSTRELVNVVKHINKFPTDSLSTVIKNVFDFDTFSTEAINTVREVFLKHGIPFGIDHLSERVFLSHRFLIEPPSRVGDWGVRDDVPPVDECAWQIPMLDVNICSDGLVSGNTLIVATKDLIQHVEVECSTSKKLANMCENKEYRLVRAHNPLLFARNGKEIIRFGNNGILTHIEIHNDITNIFPVDEGKVLVKGKDGDYYLLCCENGRWKIRLVDMNLTVDIDGFLEAVDSISGFVQYIPVAEPFYQSYHGTWLATIAPTPFVIVPYNDDRILTVDTSGGIRSFEFSPSTLGKSYREWTHLVGGAEDNDLRIEFERDPGAFDISKLNDPKLGKFDPFNAPHHGGNQWMGGTGGYSTAGLGGVGGPFRLDAGHDVHQMPESAKRQLEAKRKERQWTRHQTSGDLDDGKLIEGVTGEKNIYRRRLDQLPEIGSPLLKPKRMRLCFDVSGSMYRFNGYDKRLQRSLEAALMVMTSFEGKQDKVAYDIVGHSGDGPCIKFITNGHYPKNNKERLDILKQMMAHTQFCSSGDCTVESLDQAVKTLSKENECDERIVVLISDANLDRYGISPKNIVNIMNRDDTVNSFVIFIGSLGQQAERLQSSLPNGRAFVCENASDLPKIMQNIFTSTLDT